MIKSKKVLSANSTVNLKYFFLFAVFYENISPLFSIAGEFSVILKYIRYFIPFVTITYILYKSPNYLFKSPIVFYFLWCIYVFINNIIQGFGFYGSPVQMMLSFFPSFTVFLIGVYLFRKNENLLLNIITFSFYFFIVYALIFIGVGHYDRLGGEELNANSIGIRASLILFFLIIKYSRGKLNSILFVSLMFIPFLVIVLSASRTAFLMAFIFLLYFVISSTKNLYNLFLKILGVIFIFFLLFYTINNTLLGERLLSSNTQIENTTLKTGTIWDNLGERGYQYYLSTSIIEEFPIFGIGMGNFLSMSRDATNVFHSEYLIQLCECGIIGFILYFYLYFWALKNIRKQKKYLFTDNNILLICTLFMIAIIIAGLFTRISYYSIYSCGLAFVVSQLQQGNKIILNKNIYENTFL